MKNIFNVFKIMREFKFKNNFEELFKNILRNIEIKFILL